MIGHGRCCARPPTGIGALGDDQHGAELEKAESGVEDGVFGVCVEESDGAVTGLRIGTGRHRRAGHPGDTGN
ncbi:hypothetical protein [Streptosporangium minutum]|uniref:Uncharacterized protein n=1 Tax=Streptosporangium minutum TaxID=569862 RepID=A0A243RMT6_9ACTN|nr:hypothetical protein [Streptosporangium minutum]OUC96230.1 hypothetical protein CA984_15605 [Streptosporangium minutum]